MPSKNVQNAPARPREGGFVAGRPLTPSQKTRGESNQAPRRRGRPVGSKNKPKGILPTELANDILLQMQSMLPPEHFEYMRGVIREGKSISTKQELDTLILILNRNLLPALVAESMLTDASAQQDDDPDDFFNDSGEEKPEKKEPKIKMPVFRKDVTERLKVIQGLLALRNQVEKRDADNRDEDKPIISLFARRGGNAERLRVLIGVESSPMVGDSDGNGQSADSPRTVSDQVSERPELLPSGEQGAPDWLFDGDRSGGAVQRLHETELQG